jgi:hypothetical protein
MGGIAARVDASELRLDISERELLTNTAAIYERAKGGDQRDGAAGIAEG